MTWGGLLPHCPWTMHCSLEKVLEKGVSEVLGVASPAKAMPPTTWEGANSGAYTALSGTSLGAE